MKFMDKELKDIVVTLPFADGTECDCGVFAAYEVNGKQYFALLPVKEDGSLNFDYSYMLYRVEEDAEHNPIVLYIEDDVEYAQAAAYFADHYLDRK